MTRQRNLLHVRHLAAFTAFCSARGWQGEPIKGEFEVLRMRHSAYADVLLVHRRGHTKNGDERQHLTVWGVSESLAREFIGATSRRHGRTTQGITP